MRRINIEIPEYVEHEKNSIFSYCLSFLKEKIHGDDYGGDLKGLGNDRVVSQYNLVRILNDGYKSKCYSLLKKEEYTLSDVALLIREYNRNTNTPLRSIANYQLASKTPLYLEKEVKLFLDFINKK